ncbi:hypothetical protein [Gelidibacter gilvus]|uniref:Uncharacterized protein n=1 Tax=Gelidibacter gilvus TaxID=59602 RepID=A0A4Q0XK71_9FLAO|nr:hypothetical protein [Gelidibacter gilvus]RXJ52629.1 hypothetical protein ESZ48_02750 [Gelidibacter gilvus]
MSRYLFESPHLILILFLFTLSCNNNDNGFEDIDNESSSEDIVNDEDNNKLDDIEGLWKEYSTKEELYSTQSYNLTFSQTIYTSQTGNYTLFQINSDSTFSKKYVKRNETHPLIRTGSFKIEKTHGNNYIRLHYPDSVNLDFYKYEASSYAYKFLDKSKSRLELSTNMTRSEHSDKRYITKIYARQKQIPD